MGFLRQMLLVTAIAFVLGVSQECYSLENTTFRVADKLIPPAPFSAVLRGEDHTIFCSKNANYPSAGIISWYEILASGAQIHLFDGDTKLSDDPKYHDFSIDYDSQYEAYSNMRIKDMTISEEGTYGCSLEGEIHLATITMEVEAYDFSIETPDGQKPEVVEGIDESVVQITCKSVAARPALDLHWYQKKERDAPYTEINSGIQEVKSPNEHDGETYDTASYLRYNLYKFYNLGNLKCEAKGQIEATLPPPDVLTLVVHWKPEVYVAYDRAGTQILCNADANPDVLPEDYALIVDGNRYSRQQTLVIEITKKTEVTCEASNYIGSGEATIIVPAPPEDDGLSGGAIAGIALASVFAFGVLIWTIAACIRVECDD